jgi:hypothetical protein
MADPRGPYRLFLRDRIAPAMRRFGLKGSGNVFELPDDRYWALVGFQAEWKSAYLGAPEFTINLTFVSKAAWAAERAGWSLTIPERPSANMFDQDPCEQIRIGALIPVSDLDHDRWWSLDGTTPPQEVADEVLAAIRDHALPWFRARMV